MPAAHGNRHHPLHSSPIAFNRLGVDAILANEFVLVAQPLMVEAFVLHLSELVAWDPASVKRTDSKVTPKKPGRLPADPPTDPPTEDIPTDEKKPRDTVENTESASERTNGTPFSQATTVPCAPADTPPGYEFKMTIQEARESFGDNGKTFERDSCNVRGESFDSAEWDAEQDALNEQKEHEERLMQDQWDRCQEMLSNGQIDHLEKEQFVAAWQLHNWKEEQEILKLEAQHLEMEKDDFAFLRKCDLMAEEEDIENQNKLTPEEQALLDAEKEQMSEAVRNRCKKQPGQKQKSEGNLLHEKECCQAVVVPHQEELASQVAWETTQDDEDDISEPGEAKIQKANKPKPDPFMFLIGTGKKNVKSKAGAIAADGNIGGGSPTKPKSPPPPSKAEPAPAKQWVLSRSGLTPEEGNNNKKKKTTMKDEWLVSQEKLINSIVEEPAKQQKRWLKDALKERPEAINILPGDDVPARRECVKMVLLEAIERKKARDEKAAAAKARKEAKNAAAAAAASKNSGLESGAEATATAKKKSQNVSKKQ